jgi:hypothetical protein
VPDAGCLHEPIATGSGRKAARHPASNASTPVLGNIKSAIHRHVPLGEQGARPAPARRVRTPPLCAMISRP